MSAVSAAVISVAALLITGFALAYDGQIAPEVEVNDGGVWVTNRTDGLIARINVDAGEPDAFLSTPGDDVDVLQSGYNVLVTSARGYQPVNTAGQSTLPLVPLPVGAQVQLGGDRVVVSAPTGEVWIMNLDQAAAFNAEVLPPTYTANTAPTVAVGSDGTVFVLAGTELTRFPRSDEPTRTSSDETATLSGLSTGEGEVAMTVVGQTPVILDRPHSLLRLGMDGTDVDLNAHRIDPASAVLQQVGSAADQVVLSTSTSMVEVPLNGRGDPAVHSAGGTGDPVAPVQVAGCAYAAWNSANRYLRACEGEADPRSAPIDGAHADGELQLRVNHDLVILNDRRWGESWRIQDDMILVDEWTNIRDIETDKQEVEEEEESQTSKISNINPERTEENHPPVATGDSFGVRPGQNVVLPVLRNDTDPDGDLLTARVTGDQPGIGTVSVIEGGTQLQIEVAEDASGTASFTYEASDGRKDGTAAATVDLTVVDAATNSAPRLADEASDALKIEVASGRSVSLNVLPYMQDPEGDAFYLANAAVAPDDTVSFTADGHLTFHDSGKSPGEKEVRLTVIDEHGLAGEAVLTVDAVEDGDLAPLVNPDHVQVAANRSVTVKPLANDINPGGRELELLSITESDPAGIEATLDEHSGTVTLEGAEEGTYYLGYSVVAGAKSASSLIRVDVVQPSEEALKPVAVDDMAMVTAGRSTLVDPLQNDVDPSGGVLVLNSVTVPEKSGISATIVDHHLLRIEAEPGAAAGGEPIAVSYEVANAADSSQGTVRTMVVKSETQFAIPTAVPDTGVVRAGDVASLDVLSNDSSPTGSELHVTSLSASDAGTPGTFEIVDDEVRFTAAADGDGSVSVDYTVTDETGRQDSATATLRIVPADAGNEPPKPPNLEARTVSGTPVRIPIPTSGVDDEGDSVLLMGISSPTPQRGTITEITGSSLVYTPDEGATGTDTFRYQVMDRQGAVGTGEISVGIAKPAAMNLPPSAVPDAIEVKPDRIVQIPVLDNDSDPEGAPLSIDRSQVAAAETEASEAQLEHLAPPPGESSPFVTVTTPAEPGTYVMTYAASDGNTTTPAAITVTVDPDAPERAPVAVDDFVPAADVMDAEAKAVEVDVLANDSDPDGSVDELAVALIDPPEGVSADEQGHVRVTPQEEQQRIRYTVTDVDGLEAAGYIWVPGTAKQAPIWVGGPLEVDFGGELTIPLDDPETVRVRPGAGTVSIADPEGVSANRSDGSEMVVDPATLVYRPQEGFSGSDTITVPVTDGAVGDETAATATLSIPVTVRPDDVNRPPAFQGSLLRVEQGAAAAPLDLSGLAEDPEGGDLVFALDPGSSLPEGLEVDLDGSTLTAQAASGVEKGTVAEVGVTVSDGANPPVRATFQLSVTGSQKPLITAVDDALEMDAGTSSRLDVLANDSNPFPGGKRTIKGTGSSTPQVTVTPGETSLTVSADPDFSGVATLYYTVADETGDVDREVQGTATVTVIGAPDAPSVPRILETGDGLVKLEFQPGADNGAPITGYTVTSSPDGRTQQCTSTICTVENLRNDTEYTFQVTATNRVGASEPSSASAPGRPDVRPEKPSAPRAVRGDGELTVSWNAPVNRGSAIQTYDLQLMTAGGAPVDRTEIPAGQTSVTWGDLDNGTDYVFRVRAHNAAQDASDYSDWSRAEHPAGLPAKPAGTPKAERVGSGRITVTWPGMSTAEANGEPVTGYVVTASDGTTRTVRGADARSVTFEDMDPDAEYSFTYRGVNSVGTGKDGSAASNTVTAWAKPSQPTDVTASMKTDAAEGPDGTVTVSWKASDGNGTAVQDYVVTSNRGEEKVVTGGRTSVTFSGLSNGTAYTFQVTARNRFNSNGGTSDLSKASNSVTPFTTPDKPTVRSSTTRCTGSRSCKVSFSVTANGDGGAGGIDRLEYRIDGGSWTTYSGTVEKTVPSGTKVAFEARAWNTKDKVSSVVDGSTTAATYTAPNPTFGEFVVVAREPLPPYCEGGYCVKFDLTFSGLDPDKTYKLQLEMKDATPGRNGLWSFPRQTGKDYLEMKPNSDGTWSIHGGYNDYLYYGEPMSNVDVIVDGQVIGNFPHPDKHW
ncbi:Ig-like domain-containing protein [Brachybacterium hainanense]|uniref:Ig-like domain-containing protein n=1 Tax=Brachybacterium hainanense TaxID=1541174 RepID=A0ABV6RJR3_9MICO